MIAKIEYIHAYNIRIPGIYKAAKVTINNRVRYKNISDGVSNFLQGHDNVFVSDTPRKGFRKYKMNHVSTGGYNVFSKYAGWNGKAYLCRRGLRDLGFKNFDYIYVKVNG